MRKALTTAITAALFAPLIAGASESFPISYSSIGLEGSYVDSGNGDNQNDNLSNYFEGGVNVTHQFSPTFSVLLQGSYAKPETRATNLDTDLLRGSLGARLHPGKFRLGDWRPFGGAGYSFTDIDVDQGSGKSEDALYLEGGLQRMVAPRFMIETGIRARTELKDGYLDGQYFAGIHYLFGREFPAAPKPVVAVQPKPKPVVKPPMDTDGDGVIDDLDKCPDTPMGALVDSDGCPKELTKDIKETLYIEFELDKTTVRPEFFGEIGELATILRRYPTSSILLEGHTDSTGSATYNQQLSKSRADAVMRVLIDRFSIKADRISTTGMGETQPIASNATAEGRAQNRRVEAIVSGQYSEIIKK